MNLSKIHHIAIIVSDYEAAKNFYVNKPPLPRICLIRKVYTSQVLLIKKKLVLEQSGSGDTEQ